MRPYKRKIISLLIFVGIFLGCIYGGFIILGGVVLGRVAWHIRDELADWFWWHYEPPYNALVSLGRPISPPRWQYFYHKELLWFRHRASLILSFDRSGGLHVAQESGLFDSEGWDLDYQTPRFGIFRKANIWSYEAVLYDGGKTCRLPPELQSSMYFGGKYRFIAGAGESHRQPYSDPRFAYGLQVEFFHPAKPSVMYRNTRNPKSNTWIEVSRDEGVTWRMVAGQLANAPLAKIESLRIRGFHPLEPECVFIDVELKRDSISKEFMATSRDSGDTLTLMGASKDYKRLAVSKSNPNICYRLRDEKYFERSDTGLTGNWKPVDAGIVSAPGGFEAVWVGEISVHPQDPGRLIVATSKGALRSSDYGRSWSVINLGIPNSGSVSEALFDTKNGDFAYAATNYGFFVSRDAGITWHELDLAGCIGEKAFENLKLPAEANESR